MGLLDAVNGGLFKGNPEPHLLGRGIGERAADLTD
jgi:hypothetical protein